jgi:hypothetical protein
VTPTDRDKLLALIRLAGDAPPADPHVATDDDLLTSWRLGDLTPGEEDRFFAHLAACPACRASIVELAELLPETPEPVTVPAAPVMPSRRQRLIRTAGVASAACLVIGLVWALSSTSDSKELARAQQALNEGRLDDVFRRVEGIRPDRLRTDAERAEFHKVYEEAAYRKALAELKAGHYDEAAAHCLSAKAKGVTSSRLTTVYELATADPTDRESVWQKTLPSVDDPELKSVIEAHLKK